MTDLQQAPARTMKRTRAGGHGHKTYKDPNKDELETLSDLQKDRRRVELDIQATRDLLIALRTHHPEGDRYLDYKTGY